MIIIIAFLGYGIYNKNIIKEAFCGSNCNVNEKLITKDISYGPDERNIFDIYLADSPEPTPIVIYIHGGGFIKGDKGDFLNNSTGKKYLETFLKNNISVAVINYRYITTVTLDKVLSDIARSVQFIRYNSKKYNIDKNKIGVFGPSAGGGASLWLAVHNDLIDQTSDDPILRESSKVQVAGLLTPQSTYNLERWDDILGVDSNWQEKYKYNEDLLAYGIKNRNEINSPEVQRLIKEIDMPNYFDKNDPPLYIENKRGLSINNANDIVHSPKHSVFIKSKCDEFNLDCVLNLIDSNKDETVNLIEFFIKKLGKM